MRNTVLALRVPFVAFFFLSSLYGLLAYNPFTYTHVVQAGLLPWLSWFASAHHWLYWAAQACAIATIGSDVRSRDTRTLPLVYLVVAVVLGVALSLHPVLPTMTNDLVSFLWAEAALAPPLALAALDHVATRGKVRWGWASTREDGAVLEAGALCLLISFGAHAAVFHVRAASQLGLSGRDEAVGLVWSFLLHASFAGLAFVAWSLTRGLAALAGGARAAIEYGAIAVLASALFALLARNVAFSAISLQGRVATAAAVSWGVVLVGAVSGIALRKEARLQARVQSGLRLLMSPLSLPHARRAVQIVWLLGVLACTLRLQVVASRLDWNGLMQRLFACLGWVMVFAAVLALRPAPARGGGRTILFIVLATCATLPYGIWRTFGRPGDSAHALDKLATVEPSFGLLYDLAGSGGKRDSMAELFDFVQRNTNMPRDRRIDPIEIAFSSDLGASPGKKPHIFVIVIDSLRRDYLSPFNPAVTFTPSIDKFAHASDVFTSAFTHYGATGLSEPSIWVGGMMPHKQYITPFAPLNALEKLVSAERYVRMVSVDSILSQLLEPSALLVPLDVNTVTGDYDLCKSLDELRTKIDGRRDRDERFFAYTQPQNLHVSRITREGTAVPSGAHFPGFYDAYAWRLERIDACFGHFIEYLEGAGLYDDSIVVLTADHGDLLGEEGRWGHAYNLNPEVVRIPLIVHRPEGLKHELSVDTSAIVFSTDITPSLYRLLGYMPASLGAGFGQSLYGPRASDRDWYMLVSSYGPVYGILEDNARHLYVADAVNYTDSYFDVDSGSSPPRDSVTEEVRNRNVRRIVTGVKELHDTFHLDVGIARP